MKKILLLITLLFSVLTFAQNQGITYQAVLYNAKGESLPGINNPSTPITNKLVCLQFSIIDSNSQTEYQEKVAITTDSFGMVNLVIGTGTQTGGYASSFGTIIWSNGQKKLKVSLDQTGNCTAFEEISNQLLTHVPYALNASSANTVSGVIGIANGGTNASTILGAKTNLQLQNVDNTSDLNKPISLATQGALDTKVDKVTGKGLSTEDFTTAEKTKLASLTGTPDLSGYVPFNGAQRGVNLGNNNLQANQISGNTLSVSSVNNMAIGMKGTGETNYLGTGAMAYSPGGFANTAFGTLTLSETQGDENTAIGSQAMRSNTAGSKNTAVGRASLGGNLTGNSNTAIGFNTRVSSNNLSNTTAIGAGAIVSASNTIQLGDTNVVSVKTSGKLTTGSITLPNTDGTTGQVLSTNGSGVVSWITPSVVNTANLVDVTSNQAIGGNKTFNSDILVNGIKIGKGTGQNDQNTAIGAGALNASNANGTRNTAVGAMALANYTGTSFDNNTGVGYFNMIGLTTGGGNTSVGAETMFNVGAGTNNTGIGNQSLISTSGNNNVGVGTRSGDNLTTGSNNTFLGTQARTTSASGTMSNSTAIGYGAVVTTSNTIQLGDANVSSLKTSGKLTTGSITLPNTDGASGQVLSTNGSGVVSWTTPSTVNTSNLVDLTTNQTVAGNKTLSGITTVSNSTVSTGTLSGALVVAGGAGISGNVNVGGNETISGSLGIGTTTTNSSAALEVNSTTKGILFPRVTLAQRDLIASPAKGLVVMCLDCGQTGGELGELQVFNGSRWTNAVGTDASGVSAGVGVPAIGSSFQGGKVAYILTPSDPGYESGKVKGIIAAAQDLSTSRLRLNNGTYISTIQNGNSAIGAGLNNTNLLYAAYGTSNTTTSPSYLAYNYSIVEGGVTYDDWFIPSKDELYKLYLNKAAIGNFSEIGTAEAVYWSSNYCNGNSGAGQYVRFTDGFISCNGTENSYRVRLVRYFTIEGKTSLTADTFNGDLNGNATTATNVTGVVAIANGGTGATTATGAINALLPSQSSANGKVLTSNGTNVSWTTVGGNTHYVGEAYGGGIVFFTYDNGAHGLIVATSEIGDLGPESSASTTGITFGGTGIWTGAYRYGIGGGLENTSVIISKNSNTGTQYFNYSRTTNTLYAALSASQYLPSGVTEYYGDWYLPSKGELELLWNNRSSITGSGYNSAHEYWSSTETNENYAYKLATNGGVGWTPKASLCFVLPIRRF
jgi:hypothetical protein